MSKDKPVYKFIRRRNLLVPETGYDAEALDGIAEHQAVKCEITNFRNLGRLRSYWKMLYNCKEATGCAPTKEALHEYVKMMCGLVEYVTRTGGIPMAVPASVSFESMSEAEFVHFYQTATALLAIEFGFVEQRDRS